MSRLFSQKCRGSGALLFALAAIGGMACGSGGNRSTTTTANSNPDAQVQVLDEWVTFTRGTIVSTIVDGPDDVWFGSDGGLIRYQKSTDTWYYYTHANSGLVCNCVLSLALDQHGRVWVGTKHNGVVRFDGENWFPLQLPNQANYAPSARPLHVDTNGTLWAGSSSGRLYEYDGSNWTSYYFLNPNSSFDTIAGIATDHQGQLWVATVLAAGVFDKASGTFVPDTTLPAISDFHDLMIDDADDVWLASSQGVAKRKAGNWNVYNSSNSPLVNDKVLAVASDHDSGMWFGTAAGLSHMQGSEWSTYFVGNTDAGADSPPIFAVAASSDETTWIGTFRQGLYQLQAGTWVPQATNSSGYPGNNAYSLAEDASGTVWAGLSEGLARYKQGQWILFDNTNSPLPSSAMALAVDNDGETLWVGTPKGLARYREDTWQVYDTTNSGLPSLDVNDVIVDQSNRVWVATSAGLSVFDGTSWQTFTRSNSPLPSNRICSLALDSEANLWIGVLTDWVDSDYVPGGLVKYDGQTFEVFTTKNSGLPVDHVLGLVVDESDHVWVATGSPDGPAYQDQGGLSRFDGSSWYTFTSENSPLPNNYVEAVTSDKHGSVWVGTYQGLAKYDGSQWQVWHHNDSGLSDEVIWKILVDHRGNTWIGTGFEGLSVYKSGGVEFEM
jgi:ligand-binding sensor domain-containing protein